MHASTVAAWVAARIPAAAPDPAPADTGPSFFKTAAWSTFGATIFGLILVAVAIFMAWNAKKGNVKQNGNIVANVGLAALVFVLGITAALFPAIKTALTYFFNI